MSQAAPDLWVHQKLVKRPKLAKMLAKVTQDSRRWWWDASNTEYLKCVENQAYIYEQNRWFHHFNQLLSRRTTTPTNWCSSMVDESQLNDLFLVSNRGFYQHEAKRPEQHAARTFWCSFEPSKYKFQQLNTGLNHELTSLSHRKFTEFIQQFRPSNWQVWIIKQQFRPVKPSWVCFLQGNVNANTAFETANIKSASSVLYY